jgi:methionyl aminopeptidase
MREAGKILAGIIKYVKEAARPGVSSADLDALAEELIRKSGCKPAFLGYRPAGAEKAYPATICASVNDVVVHGVPGKYVLKSGDILKLDFGLIYPPANGFNVDAAITLAVGKASKNAQRLIETTRQALINGIEQAQVGNHLGDIGWAIQSFVEKNGFSVVRGLTGHGIGRDLHEDPPVYNHGRQGEGLLLQPGMVLAIEPMVSVGKGDVIRLDDDSFATKDHSLSAHFEHTVAITSRGPIILTE